MSVPAHLQNVELVTIRQLPWVNRGDVYTVHDLLSGLSYNVVGEHNNRRHTDYVCASKEDTAIKLKTANGNFDNNWTARPIILTIGNRNFAASTHNAAHPPDMPRWRNPADIGHSGHFCLWVLEGQTNGSDSYRQSMLSAVSRAYDMAADMKLEFQFQNIAQPSPYSPSQIYSPIQQEYPTEEVAKPIWGISPHAWGVENGITDGQRPLDAITRIEVITQLYNLYRLIMHGNAVEKEDDGMCKCGCGLEISYLPIQYPELAKELATNLLANPTTSPAVEPEASIDYHTQSATEQSDISTLPTLNGKHFTDFELEALAKMVWAEARGEDDLGQQLVVHVILNRLLSNHHTSTTRNTFPDTLLEVLFQPNQFSPIQNGAFNNATPCKRIHHNIKTALQNHAKRIGDTIAQDPARGATFFRAKQGAEGSWHEINLTRLFEHGGHVFYK